jgi:hypothetical protein
LRIGELLISDRILLHPLLRNDDDAGAGRQCDPAVIGATQLRRHDLVDCRRLDRLGDAGLGRGVDLADIDEQHHIGGAVGAFGLDTLLQTILEEDGIDLDAGVLGEGFEHGVEQSGLAGGVEVDALRQHGACEQAGSHHNGGKMGRPDHGALLRDRAPCLGAIGER